jgi:hypothetical protein
MNAIHNTIVYLRKCQLARASGYPVSLTNDPAWLVDMAINRRAGWPDDPGFTRGSAMPVNGVYPKRASGDGYSHLRLIAGRINTARLIVGPTELGEHRWLLERIPERFTMGE